MTTLATILAVLGSLGSLISALGCYYTVYTVVGFFATRRFPAAKKQHKYAVVVAARNEERVIGNLIASIRKQDYPSELVDIFVVADNCTDQTAAVARKHGAICYERFDPDHRTKGFALQFLFAQIRRDYGIESFEGYFLFDADNLLKPDYISRMNEAFDAGEKIITSYRNTKNFDENWISASYALHWLRTVRFEHRARSVLGLATRIQGTGFLFASELMKNGWNYTSLTEDRAFSADAVVDGYCISYCDAAEFYDEQPTSLRIAMRQRIRWSKGHLQAFVESGGKLFKHIFTAHDVARAFRSYDMFFIVAPRTIYSIFVSLLRILFALGIWLFTKESFGIFGAALLAYATGFCKRYFNNFISGLYVFLMERKHIAPMPWYKKLYFAATFPIFHIIGRISFVIALFMKVEWKPIPHTSDKSIDDIHSSRPMVKK